MCKKFNKRGEEGMIGKLWLREKKKTMAKRICHYIVGRNLGMRIVQRRALRQAFPTRTLGTMKKFLIITDFGANTIDSPLQASNFVGVNISVNP